MKLIYTFLISLLVVTTASAQSKRAPVKDPESLDELYASNLFSGMDGTWFDFRKQNQAQGFFNILSWLQGRVPSLQVYYVRGVPMAFIRNQPAQIFVDEFRWSADALNGLNVNDIAAIKVMRQAFVLGGTGGVIAIYTKNGDE
jgi:hypothetical protein